MVLNLISILFDYYVIYDDRTKRTIRNILTEFIVADKIGTRLLADISTIC